MYPARKMACKSPVLTPPTSFPGFAGDGGWSRWFKLNSYWNQKNKLKPRLSFVKLGTMDSLAPSSGFGDEPKKERKGFGRDSDECEGSSKDFYTTVPRPDKSRLAARTTAKSADPFIGAAGMAEKDEEREHEYDEFFSKLDTLSAPALRRGVIPRIIHKVRD